LRKQNSLKTDLHQIASMSNVPAGHQRGLLLACAPAGLLIYTTEANYQYQHDKTAQSRTERINQNRRELAAALH
jgi:hypothetical protein